MKKRLEEIKKSFFWWPMWITLAVIILDQATKIWTLSASGDTPGSLLYTVVDGYIYFVDYRNTGAAWGIFSGYPRVLSIVSLAAFIYFIFDFPYLTEGIKFRKFAWALLIGGVFGNFIDRLFRAEVIDMLKVNIPMPEFMGSVVKLYDGLYYFPAFNIADSGICVGVFLYFFHIVFFSKKKESGSAETPEGEETQAQ